MGKRSSFGRNPRDYYPTPYAAVVPLLQFLQPATGFIEPCAGDGRLVRHLEKHGHVCKYACDIEPQAEGIAQHDILLFGQNQFPNAECIITNPPWERKVLHAMIDVLRNDLPTWLLFDADWMHTGQAAEYLKYCRKVVSVGRVSWMDNGTSGMDNCCWYLFGSEECDTLFFSSK